MSTPIVRRPGMSSLYVRCPAYVRPRTGVPRRDRMPNNVEPPPYKVYRSGPRGLKSLLRGEEEAELGGPSGPSGPGRGRRGDGGEPGRRRLFRGPWTVWRVI